MKSEMSAVQRLRGSVRRHFEVGETAVTIVAEEDFVAMAKDSIFRSRSIIQGFIAQDPLFKDTLEPYRGAGGRRPSHQEDVRRRQEGERRPDGRRRWCDRRGGGAGHGRARGRRRPSVDNGGDIAMFLSEPMEVGIFAGSPRLKDLGMRFPAERKALQHMHLLRDRRSVHLLRHRRCGHGPR